MCSPILFTCHHCGRQHNYKFNPCRPVKSSTAGLPQGTAIHPFICQDAVLTTYRVACDACKERWKSAQREVRREEEREKRRKSSIAAAVALAAKVGMVAEAPGPVEARTRAASVPNATNRFAAMNPPVPVAPMGQNAFGTPVIDPILISAAVSPSNTVPSPNCGNNAP